MPNIGPPFILSGKSSGVSLASPFPYIMYYNFSCILNINSYQQFHFTTPTITHNSVNNSWFSFHIILLTIKGASWIHRRARTALVISDAPKICGLCDMSTNSQTYICISIHTCKCVHPESLYTMWVIRFYTHTNIPHVYTCVTYVCVTWCASSHLESVGLPFLLHWNVQRAW